MVVDDITELQLFGVSDRGVPNKERIVLRALTRINAGQFGIMLGVLLPADGASRIAQPIRDNLFWFGEVIVNAGDWIFVYTGPGQPTSSSLPNTTEKMYLTHWGRKQTIFHNAAFVPILFRIDAVIVG